ncbi:response regulator receiver protein [Chthoniobacter flavus Ellin428]|uniref:Response regulator receiver protein n=1 Tax=Chthoniobacter flavus Ellin428 TaxID=497964 RepID=B4D353_9BACT|nr:response regulator [Chthoniobacter flavus]EDY19164.1 response regulator receiver protein [Chthoniobacter flavus Ellin428]TCO88010.1 two-component system cell cycle response regulator DivK [Chthoniobacter flavus]
MSAKILLAEDNAANRYLETFLLEKAGYTVIHAQNGAEALRLALADQPDLVLMDLQMPEMDGYESARRIHAEPRLAETPIVAVTSFAMTRDREKALQFGFAGYIEKPIRPQTFAAEISQFLTGKAGSS